VEQGERGPKLTAEEIRTLPDTLENCCEQVQVKVTAESLSRQRLADLKELFFQHHGAVPVQLTLAFPQRGEVDIVAHSDMGVRPNRSLFRTIRDQLGMVQFGCVCVNRKAAPGEMAGAMALPGEKTRIFCSEREDKNPAKAVEAKAGQGATGCGSVRV